MKEIIGDLCHDGLMKTMEHALAFDEKRDYAEWKEQVREKLSELLRIKQIEKNACPLNMEIEEDIMLDGYRCIRFVFESEKGAFVPCYLCIPDTGKEKYPVAITLQGHSSGFHNSVGIKKYEKDESYHPRGQFALQAVKNGYAALSLELRAIGERKTGRTNADVLMCANTSLTENADAEKVLASVTADLKLLAIQGLSDSPFREELSGKEYVCEENPMGITKFSFVFHDEKTGEFRYTNAQGIKSFLSVSIITYSGNFRSTDIPTNTGQRLPPTDFYTTTRYRWRG